MRWGFSKEVNDNKDKKKRTNWGLYRVYFEWKVVLYLLMGLMRWIKRANITTPPFMSADLV